MRFHNAIRDRWRRFWLELIVGCGRIVLCLPTIPSF